MLARYQIVRGKRPPDNPLPKGTRVDTRKHTRHFLRPEAAAVEAFLARPDHAGYEQFARAYRAAVAARYRQDRGPFDALAQAAREGDVFLGCSCPSRANPDVQHCHTVLALRFMHEHYPDLTVVLPS